MVVPVFVYEIWILLLLIIPLIFVKAIIITRIIKDNFLNVIKKIVFISTFTTIIGYCVQAIARWSALMAVDGLFPQSRFYESSVFNGLFGNVGSAFLPMCLFEEVPVAMSIELLTSILIIFALLVIVERRKLLKEYASNREIQHRVSKAVISANVAFALLLLVCEAYYFMVN